MIQDYKTRLKLLRVARNINIFGGLLDVIVYVLAWYFYDWKFALIIFIYQWGVNCRRRAAKIIDDVDKNY